MQEKKECTKCGFESEENILKFSMPLCLVCATFSPKTPEKLEAYLSEKVNQESLNSFRAYAKLRGFPQKQGMVEKASNGNVMSRAPFGYNIENKKLIPAINSNEVREIFEEFLKERKSKN